MFCHTSRIFDSNFIVWIVWPCSLVMHLQTTVFSQIILPSSNSVTFITLRDPCAGLKNLLVNGLACYMLVSVCLCGSNLSNHKSSKNSGCQDVQLAFKSVSWQLNCVTEFGGICSKFYMLVEDNCVIILFAKPNYKFIFVFVNLISHLHAVDDSSHVLWKSYASGKSHTSVNVGVVINTPASY